MKLYLIYTFGDELVEISSFRCHNVFENCVLALWRSKKVTLLICLFPSVCFFIPLFLSTPMMEVENFTIFIKNSIRFPTFNYTKYEILFLMIMMTLMKV